MGKPLYSPLRGELPELLLLCLLTMLRIDPPIFDIAQKRGDDEFARIAVVGAATGGSDVSPSFGYILRIHSLCRSSSANHQF